MKPVLSDGKLAVELNTREKEVLAKAREIGVLLDSMHQDNGAPLVAAVEAVLGTKQATE